MTLILQAVDFVSQLIFLPNFFSVRSPICQPCPALNRRGGPRNSFKNQHDIQINHPNFQLFQSRKEYGLLYTHLGLVMEPAKCQQPSKVCEVNQVLLCGSLHFLRIARLPNRILCEETRNIDQKKGWDLKFFHDMWIIFKKSRLFIILSKNLKGNSTQQSCRISDQILW